MSTVDTRPHQILSYFQTTYPNCNFTLPVKKILILCASKRTVINLRLGTLFNHFFPNDPKEYYYIGLDIDNDDHQCKTNLKHKDWMSKCKFKSERFDMIVVEFCPIRGYMSVLGPNFWSIQDLLLPGGIFSIPIPTTDNPYTINTYPYEKIDPPTNLVNYLPTLSFLSQSNFSSNNFLNFQKSMSTSTSTSTSTSDSQSKSATTTSTSTSKKSLQFSIPSSRIDERSSSISSATTTQSLQLRGMTNYGGFSCYMDSALFALFAIPNKFITQHILEKDVSTIQKMCNLKEIQKSLQALTKKIRGGQGSSFTCQPLLTSIQKYCRRDIPENYRFYQPEQRDPLDVIDFLFQLFDVVPKTSITRQTTYKTYQTPAQSTQHDQQHKQYKSRSVTKNNNCIWHVPPTSLVTPSLSQNLTQITEEDDLATPFQEEGNLFRYRHVKTTFKVPSYFIMSLDRIERAQVVHRFIETEVTPSAQIQSCQLFAIIVQTGFVGGTRTGGYIGNGHYKCYFKNNGQWYLYDDIVRSNIKRIGTYEQLIRIEEVLTRSMLLFYSQEQ
jgi:hypothetical protein